MKRKSVLQRVSEMEQCDEDGGRYQIILLEQNSLYPLCFVAPQARSSSSYVSTASKRVSPDTTYLSTYIYLLSAIAHL